MCGLAIALGGLGMLSLHHFGNAHGAVAHQHWGFAGVYAALLALASSSLWRLGLLAAGRAGPVTHLLRGEVVERTGDRLEVRRFDELEDIRVIDDESFGAVGADLVLVFEGGERVVFPVPTRDEAHRLSVEIEGDAAMVEAACEEADYATLERALVFPDERRSPSGAHHGPYRDAGARLTNATGPLRRRRWSFLAPLLGVLVAPAVLHARNVLSDDASFDRALRAQSILGWRTYLLGAAYHRDEVESEHLPRARFANAQRMGLRGLLDYLGDPDPQYREEARALLRELQDQAGRERVRELERSAEQASPALRPIYREVVRAASDLDVRPTLAVQIVEPPRDARTLVTRQLLDPQDIVDGSAVHLPQVLDVTTRAAVHRELFTAIRRALDVPVDLLRIREVHTTEDEAEAYLRIGWSVQPTFDAARTPRFDGRTPLNGFELLVTLETETAHSGDGREERRLAPPSTIDLAVPSTFLLLSDGRLDAGPYRRLVIETARRLIDAP